MSLMKDVLVDIQEMLAAGCSRGFIAGELMINYNIPSKQSLKMIIDVESMINEDPELERALFTGE